MYKFFANYCYGPIIFHMLQNYLRFFIVVVIEKTAAVKKL